MLLKNGQEVRRAWAERKPVQCRISGHGTWGDCKDLDTMVGISAAVTPDMIDFEWRTKPVVETRRVNVYMLTDGTPALTSKKSWSNLELTFEDGNLVDVKMIKPVVVPGIFTDPFPIEPGFSNMLTPEPEYLIQIKTRQQLDNLSLPNPPFSQASWPYENHSLRFRAKRISGDDSTMLGACKYQITGLHELGKVVDPRHIDKVFSL